MSASFSADMPAALQVAAGTDLFGEQRGLGISTIAFKVIRRELLPDYVHSLGSYKLTFSSTV